MIVVSGTIEVDPQDAEAAVEHVLEVMRATALEEGCITYRFYRDLENQSLFRVYEEWESEGHLQAHFKTDHLATFRERIAGLRILQRSIKMMEVTNERPV